MTYSTVTSKGQITLPAYLRKLLRITPGKRVAIEQTKDEKIIISIPTGLKEWQKKAQEQMKKTKTFGKEFQNGDGLKAHVEAKHGKY
jgi:AbrB family looped-hinge helix DNA binding protein